MVLPSPAEAGARPSKASEDRVMTCAAMRIGSSGAVGAVGDVVAVVVAVGASGVAAAIDAASHASAAIRRGRCGDGSNDLGWLIAASFCDAGRRGGLRVAARRRPRGLGLVSPAVRRRD